MYIEKKDPSIVTTVKDLMGLPLLKALMHTDLKGLKKPIVLQ